MSRSCQSATFSSAGRDGGAHQPRQPGQVFGQHRVALVRHRGRALLPGREVFLRLAHFGALQMPDLGRQPLDRRGDDAERGEEGRVPVARDDLRRDRLDGCRPSFFATWASTAGSMLAKVPTGPEMAQVAISARAATRPRAAARELGVVSGELDAEGRRLGMDAVAAADAERELVLFRARFFRAASSRSTSASSRSAAWVSCTARQVSSTSDDVMP